jgi:hypothetical protein
MIYVFVLFRVDQLSAQLDDVSLQERSLRHSLQTADHEISKLEEIFYKNNEVMTLLGDILPGFHAHAQIDSRLNPSRQ